MCCICTRTISTAGGCPKYFSNQRCTVLRDMPTCSMTSSIEMPRHACSRTKRIASAASASSTASTSVDRRATTRSAGTRMRDARRNPALHHPVQQRRRLIADLLEVGVDARQRRVAQFTFDVVVVHAENGHLAGHGDAHLAAESQHLLSAFIVARQQRQRLRLAADPIDQLVGSIAWRAPRWRPTRPLVAAPGRRRPFPANLARQGA